MGAFLLLRSLVIAAINKTIRLTQTRHTYSGYFSFPKFRLAHAF